MPPPRSRARALPGTYNYTVLPANTPASGAVLAAGTWTLQVVFTPTNTTDFTTATATVQIVVGSTGSTESAEPPCSPVATAASLVNQLLMP